MADESIVYSHLIGASPSAVSALVGSKVYPVMAPAGTEPPFVVFSLVSAVPQNLLSGTPHCDNRRVQIDCYVSEAAGYGALKTLMNAVRAELEWDDRAHLISENFTDFEPDTRMFRGSLDFSFWLHR